MPVVTTPNIGLTEPEVNVSTGWGGTLNTNFTIIDNIFASDGSGTSVGLNVGSGKTLTLGGTGVLGSNDGTASASGTTVRGAAKTGSNAGGPNVVIQAGNGTGSGGSGSILLQTAPAAASSTTPNTMRTALEVKSSGVVSAPYGIEVAGSNLTSMLVPTGSIVGYAGNTAPTGWLFCDGSLVSTSTYSALFAAINYIYGGSGGSFAVPDLRGRVPAGKDNMGSTGSANRLTIGGSGIAGSTLGAAGGSESITLSITQIPAHTHSVAVGGSGSGQITNTAGGTGGSVSTSSAGSGGAHINVQPTIVVNYIIKT